MLGTKDVDATENKYEMLSFKSLITSIEENNFNHIYRKMFSLVDALIESHPKKGFSRPADRLLTTKEHPIIQALECTFLANKISHYIKEFNPENPTDKNKSPDIQCASFKLGPLTPVKNCYLIKATLLDYVIKELVQNPEKYSEILPSWGLQKDSKGKDVAIFDIPKYGQISFHTCALNLSNLKQNNKIKDEYLYPNNYVGTKPEFPDGNNPQNRHDQIVVDQCWHSLENLGKDGNTFYTYKGMDVQLIYCQCQGHEKIYEYSEAKKNGLKIETSFGGIIKDNSAYFVTIPEGTPSGEICEFHLINKIEGRESENHNQKNGNNLILTSVCETNPAPDLSNFFVVELGKNRLGKQVFSFSEVFPNEDGSFSKEDCGYCTSEYAIKKFENAKKSYKER